MNPELFGLASVVALLVTYPFFCVLSCAASTPDHREPASSVSPSYTVDEFAMS